MKDYTQYITEATSENAIAKMIQKIGPKVKKVDVRRRIEFKLTKPLDTDDMNTWDTVDEIEKLLKKVYKGASVQHDYDKFIVEE
jgi:hypothetical protein